MRKITLLLALLFTSTCLGQQAAQLTVLPSAGKSVGVVTTTSVGRWTVLSSDLSPVKFDSFKRTADAGGGSVLIFEGTAGRYLVLFVPDVVSEGLTTTSVVLGGVTPPPETPPDPTLPPSTKKVTAVTYVYEKDQGTVPRQVAVALQKLNEQALSSGSGLVASEFEEDTTDGTGQTPDQYKYALEAARKAGLPALVVLSSGTVLRVVKNPTTESQVLESVKLVQALEDVK